MPLVASIYRDSCLFIGKKVIALCYVDDILFYARKDQDINTIGNLLKKDGIMTWKEGSVECFLGVDIQSIGSTHLLTQTGLTKHIVEALGLYSSFSTATCTPAEMSSLPKDSLGPLLLVPSTMLLWSACCFICVDTHIPNIAYAVHQCARYTFYPTRCHELALVQIGRYLNGTLNKWLILSPSNTPSVD